MHPIYSNNHQALQNSCGCSNLVYCSETSSNSDYTCVGSRWKMPSSSTLSSCLSRGTVICSPRVQVSSGSAPAYLTDELCQVADVEARQRLRSSSSSSLTVSRTRLSTVGDRAFPVAAARVWNSLPDLVTSAPSVAVFRSRLKTQMSNISYTLPLVTVQCPRSDV